MANPVLVPCLKSLFAEFDLVAPGRDKRTDGAKGDAAHQQYPSDHNGDESGNTPYEDADKKDEIHAIDVDDDLKSSLLDMEKAVSIIVWNHRNGKDNRLQNVIYNRRIWSRSWGWAEHAYTGSNAHTEHAHFSARYTTLQENDTRPWGLVKSLAPQPYYPMADLPDTAKIPLLKYGMRDTDFAGFNSIDKVQKILGVVDDGWYGDDTAAAVKKWFPNSNGRSITAEMYASLMGISGVI